MSKQFKSCAKWPAGTCPGDYSEDEAGSREFCEAVAHRLMREGFGGNYRIFPLDTWVEELVDGKWVRQGPPPLPPMYYDRSFFVRLNLEEATDSFQAAQEAAEGDQPIDALSHQNDGYACYLQALTLLLSRDVPDLPNPLYRAVQHDFF